MPDWLTKTAAKVIAGAVIVAIVLGLLALSQCRRAATDATKAKLATEQAGAAAESGHEAVNTFGNTMTNEAASDKVSRENSDAIDKTSGAGVAVPGDTRAAGLQSLCRRKAYNLSHPECVQQPAPR